MYCEKVRLKIDAYLSGTLSPRDRFSIEEHLKACDGCQRTVESTRRLVILGQTSPAPPVPEGFAPRLQMLARQRIAHPTLATPNWSLAAWLRTVSIPMRAAAAVVLVIGLTTGVLMGRNTWQAPTTPPAPTIAHPDPLAQYNVDYLTEAPDGSLAQSYLALVSGPAQEGK
jgi:anti-sigma factor RsiW